MAKAELSPNAPTAPSAPPLIIPPASQAAAEPPPPASTAPEAQAIEAAGLDPAATAAADKKRLLIRAQVLLDRAHFSPGVIDGREGSNMKNAVMAFEAARGLPVDGLLDPAVWEALVTADTGPVTQDYVITEDDVKGPFTPIPTGFTAQARLERLGYATPLEGLAERFHMDEALLTALNPGIDFAVAGARIVVTRPAAGDLPAGIARIEVDKSREQVRALDAAGKVLAAFPATVGSSDRPAPTGEWAVNSVSPNPNYVYDPSVLTFGPRRGGKLTLAPGPNNPVGSTWIDLTKDTYGIHGTPDPANVGKTSSHGCVRLTNWDAAALGRAVTKGVKVVFVGSEAA